MARTTLYGIAEIIQRRIAGGQPTDDNPVKIQEIIIAVKHSFAMAVKINMYQNRKEGEYDVNGAFIFSFDDVPVSLDSDKDLYYSELPSSYIALPNEAGIQHISSMKSQDQAFIRVNPNFLTQSRGLKVGGLLGNKGYWSENDKIWYVNMDPANANSSVLIKLVVSLDEIDAEEDYINMPPEIQDEIIDRVVQKYAPMQVQMPEDTINDNRKAVNNNAS